MPTDALALTDDQMDMLLHFAAPLHPDVRPAFLESVAQALAGQQLGDGLISRVCAEQQRRFWRPPDLSVGAAGRSSKYR
jgi:hypothetical protein